MIKLMVGLGNPGERYRDTRHNLGSMALEFLAERQSATWCYDKKWNAELTTARLGGNEVALMRPQTYMNSSGVAVGAWAHFYHINPEEIVVLHDELDLAELTVKGKMGGGLNGHNGLRSIAERLGGNRDFIRIKLGIGRPLPGCAMTDFVLGSLSREILTGWQRQFERLVMELPAWLVSDKKDNLLLNLSA